MEWKIFALVILVILFLFAGTASAVQDTNTDSEVIQICFDSENPPSDNLEKQFFTNKLIENTHSTNRAEIQEKVENRWEALGEGGASVPFNIEGELHIIEYSPCYEGDYIPEENSISEASGESLDIDEDRKKGIREHEYGHTYISTKVWMTLKCTNEENKFYKTVVPQHKKYHALLNLNYNSSLRGYEEKAENAASWNLQNKYPQCYKNGLITMSSPDGEDFAQDLSEFKPPEGWLINSFFEDEYIQVFIVSEGMRKDFIIKTDSESNIELVRPGVSRTPQTKVTLSKESLNKIGLKSKFREGVKNGEIDIQSETMIGQFKIFLFKLFP